MSAHSYDDILQRARKELSDAELRRLADVSEEDWDAISETLHLLSIPGMRESIRDGLDQDLSESFQELN